MKLVTIGLYGFSEAEFFAALQRAGVDTFCDVRWRRGVRGAEYAFANRARLQKQLTERGIRYFHFRELAPTPALRQQQAEADKSAGTTKRKRSALGELFITGYRRERLSAFSGRQLLEQLGPGAHIVALFCVEREPAACHRSLLAERWQQDLGVACEVIHLTPNPSTHSGAEA